MRVAKIICGFMRCLRRLSQNGLSKEWTGRSSVPQDYINGTANRKMLFVVLIVADIVSIHEFYFRRKICHDDTG
jgi:hypothetical protein